MNKLKKKVKIIIFGTNTKAGKLFDEILVATIVLSVFTVILESVSYFNQNHGTILVIAEWVFTILFTFEYLLRVFCVKRPLRYTFSFFGIIDLLSLVPTYLSLLLPGTQVLSVIRVLRVLRIFRILKLVQYMGEMNVLVKALVASKKENFYFPFFIMNVVIILGSIMYLIEGEKAGYSNIPKSIYWAIVTLTTVGYGDITPLTPLGQTIASMIMLLGYSIIAVPTGIITSELTSHKKSNVAIISCTVCEKDNLDSDSFSVINVDLKLIAKTNLKILFILILFLLTEIIAAKEPQNWDNSLETTKKEVFVVESFIGGFNVPWGMAFLPNGKLLVSDRNGTLWLVDKEGKNKAKVSGVPKVRYKGQGGLLDIQIHPNYKDNKFIYLSYSDFLKDDKNKSFTSIVRARLDKNQITDIISIYKADNIFYTKSTVHYGTRIVFDNKGYLYFSIGDRGERKQAQLLTFPNGKTHRLHDDGSIPTDNPFVNQVGAIKSIWTYGNRNPQGLAINSKSSYLFGTEHGPKGGDELNILKKGNNYGWPEITYGKNYTGTRITKFTHKEGMEQPVIHWTPSIAVCGIDFYDGKIFKNWENNLLVTSLKFENLYRLEILDNKVLNQEMIYSAGSRIRDVETGPEGYIYLAVEDPGRIIRLKPSNE